MFKTLLKFTLENLARRWMSSSASPPPPVPSPIHLNTEELKTLVVRVGSLATLVFLNFLLFVGSIIVTAVAVAHSFDVYDHFVGTAVFWTGIIMGLTALVLGGICGWALGATKVSMKDLIVTEPVIEAASWKDRILTPFLEGLAAGLRNPKAQPVHARDEEAPAA